MRAAARACSAALLVFTAAACSSGFPELDAYVDPSEAPAALAAAAPAVVRIGTVGSRATGSFISGEGLLLTNNHVLGVEVCPKEGCYASLAFNFERGKKYEDPKTFFVVPQHVDVGLDLAVVQVQTIDAAGAPSGNFHPTTWLSFAAGPTSLLGADINAIGHPKGHLKKWTHGLVDQVDGAWFRAAVPSLPGNSGSPFLDAQGAIVGILHRGPRSIDLVSEDGENVYAVGSPADLLQAAMKDPLPDVMRSLDASVTADDFVAHGFVYRNARRDAVIIDGKSRPAVDVLADACDAGLARHDYVSPEDFFAGVTACSDAMSWIDCTAVAPSFGVCPADPQAWRNRFHALDAASRALNGQLWIDAVSYGPQILEKDKAAGQAAGAAALAVALAEADAPFSWDIAPYLATYGIFSYGGSVLVDRVRGYAQDPDYPLDATSIVSTALILANADELTLDELGSILEQLADDPAVGYGDLLAIEDVRYRWGFIE
jgi:V8-like Glu-specific endopeptidase